MSQTRIVFPCMRGAFGKWITYTCLMRLKDISELVDYANDIHNSESLSKMIQRELKKEREKEIGQYILENQERFFNSLVVAVYNGEPQWHDIKTIRPENENSLQLEIPDYAVECMGFLSLTKEERIFALDGQHRLAGIKYACKKNPDICYQQLPVIFVSHSNDEEGIKRTRRLFTTLNKKAIPVNKGAIIALDEDDVIACATRHLVEEVSVLGDDKVKFTASNNILYTDTKQITTIANLYDICKVLFTEGLNKKKKDLVNFRGNDSNKQELFDFASLFFCSSFNRFGALNEFTSSQDRSLVVSKYRNKLNGGHLLYRPLGWLFLAKAVCKVHKHKNLGIDDIINKLSKCDLSLEGQLLLDKIWDSNNKKIIKMDAKASNDVVDVLTNQV